MSADNIGYGLKIRGVGESERKARIAELVALTGIEGLEHRRIDQLSGGQRQRVALARAVAARPSVLLLDEPLTALDAALRERLRGELNRLLRMLGITAIYVTHDQSEAMALGDRIVVMRKGAIAQIGTPRDIYFAPANRFVAEFVGAANIVEAQCDAGALTLPGGKLPIAHDAINGHAGGNVFAMIRPESIRIVAPDGAALSGQVDSVSFVGDRQRASISGAAAKVHHGRRAEFDRHQNRRPRRTGGRSSRDSSASRRYVVSAETSASDRANLRSSYQAAGRTRLSTGRYRGGADALRQRAQPARPRPDLVVISGDLVDTPLPAEYDHLKHTAGAARNRVRGHPRQSRQPRTDARRAARPRLRAAEPARSIPCAKSAASISCCWIPPSPARITASSTPTTLRWLDATLGASTTRPALLFVHHPPFVTGIAHMDEINLHNAGDLAALLRKHPRARMVAAGHVHRPTFTTFAGVAATICPAPNHAVALDLDGHLPASFMIEPPAFHVHAFFDDEGFGRIVTHSVPIGEFDGPYPFSDSEGNFL